MSSRNLISRQIFQLFKLFVVSVADCAGGRLMKFISLDRVDGGKRETKRKLATNRRAENHVATFAWPPSLA